MSHAVLVGTTRRFVEAFYSALAEGDRIGTAMVRAQRALKDNPAREQIGSKRLELSDWMVPVLFQETTDSQLFPGGLDLQKATVEDRKLKARVQQGELPSPPHHGFIGRAKELLEIDRRFSNSRWVTIIGEGGLGKTELANEAARWRLAMRRAERVAFVSVEQRIDLRQILDCIRRQLIAGGYSEAIYKNTGNELERCAGALLAIKGALARRKTIVVVDNFESVLPSPRNVLEAGTLALLELVRELSDVGETRIILTSRESIPTPLDGNEMVLPPFGHDEALAMLAAVVGLKGGKSA